MGKSISESIDELFDNSLGGLPSKRPKRLQEEVTSSPVFDQGVVDELYNLFEEELNDDEIITESIVEEVVSTIQEDVVETPVEPTPEVDVTSQLNSVDYLADKLTRYVKRTNTGVQPEQEININEAIENLTRQVHDVRRMVLENTIVSGIGQGGDGQTPGSGEVLLNRLDDVDPSQLNHGDTLVWDSEENKWVTSNVFLGNNNQNGDVTTDIVGLINSDIIKNIISRIRNNVPDLENLSTQEDANIEILKTLLKLEQHKPTIKISEEKEFEDPSEMDNSLDIGDLRIDYTTNIMYYWNGNKWQALNAECCFEQNHYIIDGLYANSVQSDYEGDFEDLLADIGVFDGIDGDAGDASFDPNLDTEGED